MEEKQPEKDEKLESQQPIEKKTNGVQFPAGPPFVKRLTCNRCYPENKERISNNFQSFIFLSDLTALTVLFKSS